MSNVYSIINGQPIIQDNDTGSQYFRTTSACKPLHEYKPSTMPASKKREILLIVGWSEYIGETITCYTNRHVDNNNPHYLADAWKVQLMIEYEGRVSV